MASLTITELDVLTAIVNTDHKEINRLIKSTEDGKTVVGQLAKVCFRELLNRHIILTPTIFQFIQKTLIDCKLYPSLKEPAKSNTNGQRINRIKYTLYYMNEIAMHEGDPDELLWHNVQMALACAYKVQHDVIRGLPWRKLINYLNIFQKQHLTETGIDQNLVPKLVAIVTCFVNALEISLLSKQKISQIKVTFQDNWMKNSCDDYYWQIKDVDTVNKMIKSFISLDELKQAMKEKGHISSIEFLGLLRICQSIGELCKNTHTSPNMSKNLEIIFTRYVPEGIKHHLIGLRNKISHLKKYPKIRSFHQDLLRRVIQSLNLLSNSILLVKQDLLSEEITRLKKPICTSNEIVVFRDLVKLIDITYNDNKLRNQIKSNINVCSSDQRDMEIVIRNKIFPNILITERNKIAHNDDVPNHLKRLFEIDYFPRAEIKLLLHNNHNIRRRHIVQLNTDGIYKQSQLHIATIENNIIEASELVDSGTPMDQNDIAGFCAMFYAIRSDSFLLFYLIYKAMKIQCTRKIIMESLLWAINVSNVDVIDLVVQENQLDLFNYIENNLSLTPFRETIQIKFPDVMKTLIQYKEQQIIDDSNCRNLLNRIQKYIICIKNTIYNSKSKGHACSVEFLDLVKFLVENILDVNAVDSDGFTALHHASNKGELKCIALLLNNNANTNIGTSKGFTPLHFVSNHGYDNCVKLLLNHNSDIHAVDSIGWSALHFASYRGHRRCVELLLNHNSDINAVTSNGWTALHWASSEGHYKCVKLLLNNNSDIDAISNQGLTALHSASNHGHYECVELLLKNNSNIHAVDSYGLTALHRASIGGHDKCIALLLKNNSDVNVVDSARCTAMHFASEHGYDKCVELLLNNNSDINAIAVKGVTALHCASYNGHDKCVELLLKNNSDVNAVDSNGFTALHFASTVGHAKCVELLLNHNSDINAVNSNRLSALHCASNQGHDKCVELLLNNNSNINAVDLVGLTALHRASANGHHKCIELLLKKNADINFKNFCGNTPLHDACFYQSIFSIKTLLAHKADVYLQNFNGLTALHIAAGIGLSDVVNVLLEHNINAETVTSNGSTALHDASYYGHKEVVQLLLSHGASINAKDSHGHTPLHDACFNDNIDILELLIKNGCNINERSYDGETPLHVAATLGYRGVVDILLKHNINVDASDSNGYTALHNAAFRGHNEIVEILLTHNTDINAKDSEGDTALHSACVGAHIQTIETLLRHDAKINSANLQGATALHYVVAAGNTEIVTLLLTRDCDVNAQTNNGVNVFDIARNKNHFAILDILYAITYSMQ